MERPVPAEASQAITHAGRLIVGPGGNIRSKLQGGGFAALCRKLLMKPT